MSSGSNSGLFQLPLKWWQKEISIAPLVTLRIFFGLLMFFSTVRFILKGWVHEFYVMPQFHFTFYGLDFIKPLPGAGMYVIYGIMVITSLGMAAGYFYRLCAWMFFLLFTYTELLDKSYYLNHYYFVSIMAFVLALLPAGSAFSIDVWKRKKPVLSKVPAWVVWTPKLLLCLVYFYAGAAKLNSDWMWHALPLKIWLPSRAHYPVVGELFAHEWVAYLFSWGGIIYDLSIPFLLLMKRTRKFAFMLVIGFHLMTAWLFPIGMFPYIMIVATMIFFSDKWHETLFVRLGSLKKWVGTQITLVSGTQITQKIQGLNTQIAQSEQIWPQDMIAHRAQMYSNRLVMGVMIVLLAIQVILPWRYLLYPGHLFWTEEGYRFSWRVMLMEKAGMTIFYVKDKSTGTIEQVLPACYLTPQQEKMMSTQPDMILQFAHFLADKYKNEAIPEVRVESYVALNGRRGKPLIDPSIDLAGEKYDLQHRKWVLPFEL